MTIRSALRQARELLDRAGVAEPRLAAELLLCHVLRCERAYLYAHPERELSDSERAAYERAVFERSQGKPTQYLTGKQEFYGREFLVTPAVLIPRPETEHVVEVALQIMKAGWRVVDVGCGSGAIAVTLSLECGQAVWATDISAQAVEVARENARRLGARVEFAVADLLSCFLPGSLDMVVSNPPYVPLREEGGLQREVRDFEPRIALFGGEDGTEVYSRLITQAGQALKAGGWLIVELGYRAREHVEQMLRGRWEEIRVWPDLAGLPRVLSARLRQD